MNPTTQIQTGVLTVFMPNDQSAIAQYSTAQHTQQHSTAQHKHKHSTAQHLPFLCYSSLSFSLSFCLLFAL
jgi:hypothetical protein